VRDTRKDEVVEDGGGTFMTGIHLCIPELEEEWVYKAGAMVESVDRSWVQVPILPEPVAWVCAMQ
jgi:hypothetical protein